MRVFALTALLFVAGCPRPDPAPPLSGPLEPVRPGLKQMVLKRQTNGKEWKLSDDLGQVVLLDVWATWCEPCADSLPMYHDFLKQYGARGLKVYGINIDADSKAVKSFLEQLKVEIPVLLDPGAQISEAALEVKVMPSSYLIDRKGNLRYLHEGFAEEFLRKYVTEIEELLGEK